MFRFKGEPLGALDRLGTVSTVVQLRSLGHRGQEEGHAVVVQGGTPLSHGRVNRIEDVVGVVQLRRIGGVQCPRRWSRARS